MGEIFCTGQYLGCQKQRLQSDVGFFVLLLLIIMLAFLSRFSNIPFTLQYLLFYGTVASRPIYLPVSLNFIHTTGCGMTRQWTSLDIPHPFCTCTLPIPPWKCGERIRSHIPPPEISSLFTPTLFWVNDVANGYFFFLLAINTDNSAKSPYSARFLEVVFVSCER